MPTSYRARLVALLREQETLFAESLATLRERLRAITLSTLPSTREPTQTEYQRLKDAILAAVVVYYLGRRGDELTPFVFAQSAEPYPLSPFATFLYDQLRRATQLAIDQQALIMRSGLRDSPEIIRAYENAALSPLSAAGIVLLSAGAQRVLERYRNPLTARRANGRSTVDSIIDAAAESRRKTAALLDELIAEKSAPADILNTLSVYFTPGRLLDRYNKPYGRTGIDRAQQIVRSAPVFAYSSAAQAGALVNPFVDAVIVSRSSPNAPPCEICDPMVGTYAIEDAPLPGFHQGCVCKYRFTRVPRSQVDIVFPVRLKTALSPSFASDLLRKWM